MNTTPLAWLLLAVVLEVLANILLKYSAGFRRWRPALASILCVFGAFTALAQAVRDMDLAVAYALWGGFGVLATVVAGALLFQQRLTPRAGLGLAVLLAGMGMLKFGA
ncbi:multidrug efflux system protein MdtI [Alcanivorax sp. S71-1-4]|jgi:spermidine export protein MdtI|uniref:multidrug/spermidine efflux SMR transporter subunit MdtI n=1 Tax=Alcanivorax sp. S71-1-4 TaxID=1177159 RepID=UPI00135A113D|nr:multidrug/spermidine efflux SMR transporter subunit MdtI [Alcanivorax sp. S71-1-4]KAF0810332.1 multidrug efflux system protein MdtI [Alcanivorax sp. S71-1-4]